MDGQQYWKIIIHYARIYCIYARLISLSFLARKNFCHTNLPRTPKPSITNTNTHSLDDVQTHHLLFQEHRQVRKRSIPGAGTVSVTKVNVWISDCALPVLNAGSHMTLFERLCYVGPLSTRSQQGPSCPGLKVIL